MDLLARQPLTLAVIPLDEIRVDNCSIREAGDLAGLSRPLQRADEHRGEAETGEPGEERRSLRPTLLGQRQVRASGVSFLAAPRGLAVAHDDDPLRRVGVRRLHEARL